MKYLIMEDFSGQMAPFIFPRKVAHEDMREQLPYTRVVSCGYLELGADGLPHCGGGCVELDCNSRPEEDEAIIIQALREEK